MDLSSTGLVIRTTLHLPASINLAEYCSLYLRLVIDKAHRVAVDLRETISFADSFANAAFGRVLTVL